MTRYATILLLASTINAQFAGDAAAGSKPRDIATRPTNWLAQANKQASTKPKRKSWKRVKHIPVTDPRNPFYVDPNAPRDHFMPHLHQNASNLPRSLIPKRHESRFFFIRDTVHTGGRCPTSGFVGRRGI